MGNGNDILYLKIVKSTKLTILLLVLILNIFKKYQVESLRMMNLCW